MQHTYLMYTNKRLNILKINFLILFYKIGLKNIIYNLQFKIYSLQFIINF